METMQEIINQIPIRHNWVSQFVLMGVFLGLFLSLIILFKTSHKSIPTKFLGLFILVFSIVLLDTYLCYTGLMKYCISFNDSTEPLVLLWAPFLYFFINGLMTKKSFKFKIHWYHFILPLAYFFSQIGYYIHPINVKLTAYISAYHPNMERPFIDSNLIFDYEIIKHKVRYLMIGSFLFYIGLSLKIIFQNQKAKSSRIKKDNNITKIDFSNNLIWIFLVLILLTFIIFINFENDLGDHYIALFQTILILIISYMILSESRFFEKSWLADKYETLKIQDDSITLNSIQDYVEKQNYFQNKDASLNDLAHRLDTNANLISKIINQNTNTNFNEFINNYRIELSKIRLIDDTHSHLTIEGIGSSVGFKSKSAFYTAFKKCTGTTPSVFIKNN